MSEITKKLLENPYDGKEIKDSLGRTIKLKKPDILDKYDLMSVLGADSQVNYCLSHANLVLYAALLDGQVLQSPKTKSEFRFILKTLGDEGLNAILEFIMSVDENLSEKDFNDSIKK